ncbi:MAG: phospholipase D-like domain-containing protein [Pseudomonadota bacterium]
MNSDLQAPSREPRSRLLEPGRNCWRLERAERMGLIVDAADYFVHLRGALLSAQRQVLMIGWDFDLEIEMLPGQSDADGLAPDGYPNAVGPFIRAVVERSPDLRFYMLKWNGAALLAPGRIVPSILMSATTGERIRFALDGHHPFGACHHQKIAVVDDALAFCGGIDVTEDRWDTSAHMPNDPWRVRKDGSPAVPWHDATTALTGPTAAALGELARDRWHRATGETLDAPETSDPTEWPEGLEVALRDVEVAIARTEPPYDGTSLVNEIERLYLDGIAAARETIYLESQYFAAESVCDAIEARLREPGGPEVVVLNPEAALAEFEDSAMHPIRGRMIERLRAADAEDRFRIWHPVNAAGEPIYVHAKVMVIDDLLLRIGSSNLNDRSMGFDTECDVAVEGGDEATRRAVLAFRHRLVAEHLGVKPADVSDACAAQGTLITAMEALRRPEGRGLREIERRPEGLLDSSLADTQLLNPRYEAGRAHLAGRGIRPRYLAAGAAVVALGIGLWFVWRRTDRD